MGEGCHIDVLGLMHIKQGRYATDNIWAIGVMLEAEGNPVHGPADDELMNVAVGVASYLVGWLMKHPIWLAGSWRCIARPSYGFVDNVLVLVLLDPARGEEFH